MPSDARGVQTMVVKAEIGRQSDADGDLAGRQIGRQHRAPIGIDRLADAQRHRQRYGRRVDHRRHMGIVEIKAVNQRAIGDDRIAQR